MSVIYGESINDNPIRHMTTTKFQNKPIMHST